MVKEYCFDIDGIITIERNGHDYAFRTVNEITKNTIQYFYKAGMLITIYTSRMDVDWLVTQEWLKEQDIPFHRVVMGKPKADAYVDDMTVPDPELLHWLTAEIPTCWREQEGKEKNPLCFQLMEQAIDAPLLTQITLARCLKHCHSKVITDITMTGFADLSVIKIFQEAMRRCHAGK
jgi:hypothetical protein